MHRSFLRRLCVLLLGATSSLALPAIAVGHGVAHEHDAEHHGTDARSTHARHDHDADVQAVDAHTVGHQDGEEHRLAEPRVEQAAPDHQHGHAILTQAAATRDAGRLQLDVAVAPAPMPLALRIVEHEARPLASWDASALARPAPYAGPPPSLRAPPTR